MILQVDFFVNSELSTDGHGAYLVSKGVQIKMKSSKHIKIKPFFIQEACKSSETFFIRYISIFISPNQQNAFT